MAVEILRAVRFAAWRHRDQRRKCPVGEPYIQHPIRVAELVAMVRPDDVHLIQAALLHDTVEDTATTFTELRLSFGSDVAALVSEVTDDKSLPADIRKERQVEHAPHCSERAKILKLADKIANIEDLKRPGGEGIPVGWTEERVNEYFKWATRVVAGLRGCSAELEAQFDQLLLT